MAGSQPCPGFELARELWLSLPGVEEAQSYGTPGFKLKGKFLGRLREDGETLVVKTAFEQRDALMSLFPESFFTTDHYRGYPSVLVRLSTVDPEVLRDVLVEAWRALAPKRMVAEWEASARQEWSTKEAGRVVQSGAMKSQAVPERLQVRLDEDRRRKLAEMLAAGCGRASDIAREGIDLAYDEYMLQRRLEAVRRIGTACVEEMPGPDKLARQIGERYAAAQPPEESRVRQ
jgi:hypothetical protein